MVLAASGRARRCLGLGQKRGVARTVTIVLLNMGLHCLFGMASGVNYMAHRDVSVMSRGFVAPCLVCLAASS